LSLKEIKDRATIPLWPDAGRLLELSKNSTYKAARAGEIPGVLRFGRKYVVAVPAFLRWLECSNRDKPRL
jgi:hypothetical protein